MSTNHMITNDINYSYVSYSGNNVPFTFVPVLSDPIGPKICNKPQDSGFRADDADFPSLS